MLLSACQSTGQAIQHNPSAYDQYGPVKQRYDTLRQNYSSAAPSFTGQTPEKILRDYEIVLSAFSQAAQFWLRARLEETNFPPPPPLDALPAPSGKATIADVDASYERMLHVEAEMFRIDEAAPTRIVEIPDDPPLPPLQKASDPRFARLVKIHNQMDTQIHAIVARIQARAARANAVNLSIMRATAGMPTPPSEPFDPMTGRPYRGAGGSSLHNPNETFTCGSGPGPGQRQVGVSGGGNGVAPIPICSWN